MLANNFSDDLVQEPDDISQDFGSSTQHPSSPSIQDSNTPSPKTPRASEPPKKVCKPGILPVLGHLTLFHLPPIAITLALVALYSVNFRWGGVSDEQLSYLQFAAKGHETLIIVSLADILMHRIRYTLLQGKRGVPLGFLSSSFLIGSPISYFFSWELWGPLLRPATKSKRARIYIQLTGILIIISVIISVAAAPLSAIVIIPRSGWWHIHHVSNPAQKVACFIEGPLWETDLRPRYTYDSLGRDNMLQSLNQLGNALVEEDDERQRVTNVSFSFVSFKRTISIATDFSVYKDLGESMAFATTPMEALQQLPKFWSGRPSGVLTRTRQKVLGDLFRSGWDTRVNLTAAEKWKEFRRDPISRWKQPISAVECLRSNPTTDTATFVFKSNITDNKVVLNAEDNNDFKAFLKRARENDYIEYEAPQVFNETGQSNETDPHRVDYLFLDLPGSHTSAAILFYHTDMLYRGELSLCRIYSRWVEADTWLEPGESVYRSHLRASLFDIQAHFGNSTGAGDLIIMSQDWLNTTHRSQFPNTEQSSYQYISEFCKDLKYKDCLSVSVAAYMTHILSQTDPAKLYHVWMSSDIRTPSTGDSIILEEYFVDGYGYGWKSSRTIPFAFSVLLLHVLMVLIHMTIVLWPHHTWHSSSWGSFGQMMVLALRSRALDGLGSVGAGVSSSRTWSTSVSVRVVDGEDRLEMVLQNQKGGLSQYQEIGGEGEEEGFDRGSSLVQPGVKYH
ncbi:hypothetical protein FLAG1_02554 [Fusarium langsethiae]|uniref:Uncharacterized protein n=1 Tax=Fusarium langsethiae TaxID=179993 RepID=A0A0N0V815_FUSLA|nr:hypothetical protein FLAG1_02554 [Fusarium langsethiae]GKU00995.1 unnamed protein product [Fusarium langsethiae]GKU19196.1 unnamed protein product [Fusarium langsethiae]